VSTLWVVPAIVLAAGLMVAGVLMRELAAVTRALRDEVSQLGTLRPAVVRLLDEADRARAALGDLRRR
jgi:hypothetical protein